MGPIVGQHPGQDRNTQLQSRLTHSLHLAYRPLVRKHYRLPTDKGYQEPSHGRGRLPIVPLHVRRVPVGVLPRLPCLPHLIRGGITRPTALAAVASLALGALHNVEFQPTLTHTGLDPFILQ